MNASYLNLPPTQRSVQRIVDQFNEDEQKFRKRERLRGRLVHALHLLRRRLWWPSAARRNHATSPPG